MMQNNATNCATASGIHILPNTTDSRVCAVTSPNNKILDTCCNGEVHSYQCMQYCHTTSSMTDFAKCVTGNAGNSSSVDVESIFCQKGLKGTTNETVPDADTSGAFRTAGTPKTSLLLLVVLLGFFFSSASAAIVPSLAGSGALEARADSSDSCTIEMDEKYTTVPDGAIQASAHFSCESKPYCTMGMDIDTGITNNNRTINGTSAAESKYDKFFSLLEDKTGRKFPAMSSAEFYTEFVVTQKDYFMAFTPFLWCMNGTVTDCADVLGDSDDATRFEACGPLFVSEYDDSSEEQDQLVIQGILNPVSV